MTTRTDPQSAEQRAATLPCPPWCDPSEHLVDVEEGVISVVHQSRRIVVDGGWVMPRIVRTDRGTTVESLIIDMDVLDTDMGSFGSREEAHKFLLDFIGALTDAMCQAWPTPGDNPRAYTAAEMADVAADLRQLARRASTQAKQLAKV